MSLLTHKGYYGSVAYDADDDLLHGRILNLHDIVTYEGQTVAEIKQAFTEAVEGYLRMCTELGQAPEKPFSGRFNLRIDPDLHRRLALKAAAEHTSLNALVEDVLRAALH